MFFCWAAPRCWGQSLLPLITLLPQNTTFFSVGHLFCGSIHSHPPEQKSIQSEPSSVGGHKMAVSCCFFPTDHGWYWRMEKNLIPQSKLRAHFLVINLFNRFQWLQPLKSPKIPQNTQPRDKKEEKETCHYRLKQTEMHSFHIVRCQLPVQHL